MLREAPQARPPPRAAPRSKITAALKPVKLDIIDESHKHAGHAGNPSGNPNAETHFKWVAAAVGCICRGPDLIAGGAGVSATPVRTRSPCCTLAAPLLLAPQQALPAKRRHACAPARTARRNTPPTTATRVVVVSGEFEGKRLVQRHQIMYRLLDDEIKAGVHALSMDTKTPGEVGL